MNDFELMPGEEMIKRVKGDCWQTPTTWKQVPGEYGFTNKQIIFRGGGMVEKLRVRFKLAYADIETVKPYRVLFFNTGIHIVMKNGECYRISVMKRKQYLDLIEQYRS